MMQPRNFTALPAGLLAGAVSVLTLTVSFPANAADPASRPAAGSETLKVQTSDADEEGTLPEKIDVQAMKKRYWTVGNEDLMDVVQNRQYVKKGRVETSVRYGFYSDDPFVSSSTITGSLGYHFNEFFSLHANYSSVSSGDSSAYVQASQQTPPFLPVVIQPKSVYGVEGRGSLIYGKLSLLGNAIIYYDFNFSLGASNISYEVKNGPGNGQKESAVAITAGLGQQVYLNKTFFITMDYRLMTHSDKYPTTGNPSGSRSVTTNWILLGLGAFLF